MTTIPASTSATATAATAATTTKDGNIMGKEDFLTLLVAQLKNQDPLNPDDPTEFTAQLAQFSSLEQLYNLNDSMTALTTAQANSEKLSALSLIGKDVSYNSGTFTFNGDPVDIGYQLDGAATSVTLSIQDSSGRTVKTIQVSDAELDAGNHFLSWDGTDLDGNTVADGTYKIVLQASAAGKDASVAVAPLIRSEVTGVDLSANGNGMLTTRAGEVLFSKIIGVTEAENTTNTTETETSGTETSTTADTTASTDAEQTVQNAIDSLIQKSQS